MKVTQFSIIALLMTGFFFTSCKKDTYIPPPPPIVVNAGPSQTIQLPKDSVTLSGTVISGQTPTLIYSWTYIVGPNVPVISNNNSLIATINGLITGTYIFQFEATNNTGTVIGEDTVSVVVAPVRAPIINTITIQPGAVTGQDAFVSYVPGLYDGNGYGYGFAYLIAGEWTWYAAGAGQGTERTFIKFTALDTLPANAVITSAELSLSPVSTIPYSGFIPDSYYPGSSYDSYGDNQLWLQRCTQNWDKLTLTYNNQPTTTNVDEVDVPASTSEYNYAVTNLDVTQLIKDMKTTPGTNYGFLMRLQNEAIYRSMAFDASRAVPDSSTGPKLIVTYQY